MNTVYMRQALKRKKKKVPKRGNANVKPKWRVLLIGIELATWNSSRPGPSAMKKRMIGGRRSTPSQT